MDLKNRSWRACWGTGKGAGENVIRAFIVDLFKRLIFCTALRKSEIPCIVNGLAVRQAEGFCSQAS
jgi:hypothetical protein